MALLEMGLPEQRLDEEADPFIMLLQSLVIGLHLVDEVPEILLGILKGSAFRLPHLADALQFLQGLDLVPQMPQVEGQADIGDDDVVFDIGHQAVDEADVLDVLPGDDLDVQVVAQAVGVLLEEKLVLGGNLVAGEDFQHADDPVFGIKGQLVHQDLVAPDGDQPGVVCLVGLALQPDMGQRRGLFRVNPVQAVAHQFQAVLRRKSDRGGNSGRRTL